MRIIEPTRMVDAVADKDDFYEISILRQPSGIVS